MTRRLDIGDNNPDRKDRKKLRAKSTVVATAAALALSACSSPDTEATPQPEHVREVPTIQKVELSPSQLENMNTAAKRTALAAINALEADARAEYAGYGMPTEDIDGFIWDKFAPGSFYLSSDTTNTIRYKNKKGEAVRAQEQTMDSMFIKVNGSIDGTVLTLDYNDHITNYRDAKTNKSVRGPQYAPEFEEDYKWVFVNPDIDWAGAIDDGADLREFIKDEQTRLVMTERMYDEDQQKRTLYDIGIDSFKIKGKTVRIGKWDPKHSESKFLEALDSTLRVD